MLDVEYHHYVDRVIKVEVATTDAGAGRCGSAPESAKKRLMDADSEDSAVESTEPADEASSNAALADELARVSRETLLEISAWDANEQIAALLVRENELYDVNAQLAAEMKAIEAQQHQMREFGSAVRRR